MMVGDEKSGGSGGILLRSRWEKKVKKSKFSRGEREVDIGTVVSCDCDQPEGRGREAQFAWQVQVTMGNAQWKP